MRKDSTAVRGYEEIIKTRQKNIIFVAYRQSPILKKVKQKENFIKIIKRLWR